MSTEKNVEFDTSSQPKHGILQKTHNFEQHETPQHKIHWDENKLKWNEKEQAKVTMKVDEPNTPFVRYDAIADKVTNWQDLPESVRAANDIPDDDDFALDNNSASIQEEKKEPVKLDKWDLEDEQEEKEKQDRAKQKHEAFLKKRAQHYYHDGFVFHKQKDDDE